MTVVCPVELPPRKTTPLAKDGRPLSRLVERWPEELQSPDVYCVVKTRTKVDTGWWFFHGRIWAIATPEQLVLIAAGKRPLSEQISYGDLHDSQYNHITGCLVLGRNIDKEIRDLKMNPVEGYQLLAQIYQSY